MKRVRRALIAVLLIGTTGFVSGAGTFSRFSSSTSNGGNVSQAGTVAVGDNDTGSSMWSVSGQLPGATVTKCIRLTYTGSLAATVKLYTTSASTALDPYLDLTIEKGSMPSATSFPGCAGFSSESTIFSPGTLASFKSSKTSYASGIAAYPGAQTQWNTNDTLVYRFTLTLQSTFAAQGLSSSVTFTWEAQNQ